MNPDDAHDPDLEPGIEEAFDPDDPAHHGTVDPEVYAPEPRPSLEFLTNYLRNMLVFLCAGHPDNAQIGRRVRLLLFAAGGPGPKTLEELAPLLGVSVATAWRSEMKLRSEIAQICPEFDDWSAAVRSGVKKTANGK